MTTTPTDCAHAAADAEAQRTQDYLGWRRDADRRLKAGERQRRCLACDRWRWPDEITACPAYRGKRWESEGWL